MEGGNNRRPLFSRTVSMGTIIPVCFAGVTKFLERDAISVYTLGVLVRYCNGCGGVLKLEKASRIP